MEKKIQQRDALPVIQTSQDRKFPNGAPAVTYNDLFAYIDNEIITPGLTNQNFRFEWPDLIVIVQASTNVLNPVYNGLNVQTLVNSCSPMVIDCGILTVYNVVRYTMRMGPNRDFDGSEDVIRLSTNGNWEIPTVPVNPSTAVFPFYRAWLFQKTPGITMDPAVPWPTTTPYTSVYQSASTGPVAKKTKEVVVGDKHDLPTDRLRTVSLDDWYM